MTIQNCKNMAFKLLVYGTLFCHLTITDATITWTLPPPQRGPLQTSDNTIRTTIQKVIKGSSEAYLTWSFTLSGVILDRVAFRKGFLRIGKKTSSGMVTVEQEHFNISRSDPATLIIYNVTEADEAVYSCDVETDKKTWTDVIQVKVGVPASLTNVSPDKTVREESNLQLLCEATGNRPLNITWTRVLEDDSNSEVLYQGPTWDFPNIKRNASGTYCCEAYNGFGAPATHKVIVNVTYPPEVVKVSVSKRDVKVQESISLQCTAEGNPQPTYTWKPCDSPQRDCHKRTLDVLEVLYDDVYICTVTNYLGNNSGNASVFIAGNVINVTLVITSESCTQDGKYNETSLWTKLNKTINEAFANERRYISAQLRDVRCGSISIDLGLNFNSTIREREVIDILRDAAKDGMLGDFEVDVLSIVGTRPIDEKPTKAATTSPSSSSDSKTWIIVGAVLGSLALLAVTVVVGWCVYRKRKCKKRDTKVHNNGSHEEAGGNAPNEGYVEVNKGYEGRTNRYSGGGNRSSVPPVIYDTAQTSNREAVKEPPQYSVVDKSKKNPKKRKPGELQYAELAEFSAGQGGPRSSTSPTNRPTEIQYADVNAM